MGWDILTNFTAGVLDPKLKGRIDLDIYKNGVEEAINVIALPQGGMTKRPGFEFLAIPSVNSSRLFAFEFNLEQSNVIAATSVFFQVFDLDGVLIDTELHTFGADIFNADFVQSGDFLILVHKDHAPGQLVRDDASNFTFSDIPLVNIPQFDYADASSPIPVTSSHTVTFANFNTSDRYRLVFEEFLTEELSYSSTASDNEDRMRSALNAIPLFSLEQGQIAVQSVGGDVYVITFLAGAAGAYGEINGLIVESISVNANITDNINTVGSPRKEDVWSATRGWPVSVIFHEGRLILGGSRDRPATIWMSVVNDFFNFKEGVGRDDEAVVATLDTDQLNAIVGLSSNRNLQIFTSGQEFFVPTDLITPSNLDIKPQSSYGAKAIKPHVIDGFTCYIQRTGRALRRFIFTEFETSYESISVSFLAPALVKNPVDMTVQAGGHNDIDAPFLYLVNDDGTMSVYSSKKEERLNPWVTWTTGGLFKSVVAVGDELFVIVERVIDSSTVFFLEKLFNDSTKEMWLDAGVRYDQAASTTISGLGHLDGESVRVVPDGVAAPNETPVAGSITVASPTTFGWVGLDYNPSIKPMPAQQQTQAGPDFPTRRRIGRVRPLIENSIGVFISNGTTEIELTPNLVDPDATNSPPEKVSGIGQGVKFLGYSYDPQLRIFQKDPYAFTITSLAAELK